MQIDHTEVLEMLDDLIKTDDDLAKVHAAAEKYDNALRVQHYAYAYRTAQAWLARLVEKKEGSQIK